MALFAGWLLLIFSLFWDPITPHLTLPDNTASPFRIKTAGVTVQGEPLLNEPYALGARLWWALVVPILPFFLMLFGHEAWRRVCPLSFASQIARRVGLNRKKAVLQRRTGKVEHTIILVKRNSWLQRNAWYLQGGLLFAGLSTRLLFINSNRVALGLFLLAVIIAAVVVGYLYGGKTWCNYFCPVNVVQKIYTEPRGILESAPHLTRPAIPQSMCRTPGNGSDTSACVGCTSNCGDIDLEKSYWDSIGNPQRRHVYYMFWGLILGFYGYYYLYSGTWEYYFSGIWTHETGALGRLFDPGFYINGTRYGIPKLLAAPLTLAATSSASLLLGLSLEKLYRRTRAATKRISEPEILHHCMAFTSYLSINTFYLFGGRPNLLLLPETLTRCIDIVIVSMTTWWLLQAIQRTPFKFRRESMASSLLEQLKRLRVDVTKYLDGRTIDDLKPDEVYVLTKVLPAFSHEQKLTAYRQILDDAIATGKTKSAVSLGLLHEMRVQMNISDEEHHQLIETLRTESSGTRDALPTSSHEKWECLRNYTEILGPAVVTHIEAGRTLEEALDDPELASTSAILRASFQISEVEHTAVLGNITSASGLLMGRVNQHLASMNDLLSVRFCMHSYGMTGSRSKAISELLTSAIDGRIESNILKLLSLLRAVGDSTEARWNAHNIAVLGTENLRTLISQPVAEGGDLRWDQVIHPDLVRILLGDDFTAELRRPTPEGVRAYSFREVISSGIDLPRNLHRLTDDSDPIVLALVLAAFHDFDASTAHSLAENVRHQNSAPRHPLLDEMVSTILDGPRHADSTATFHKLSVSISMRDEPLRTLSFSKPYVTVGRATDNDISISSPALAPYHLTIERRPSGFSLLPSGDEPLYVDGRLCEEASVEVHSGATVSFAAVPDLCPHLHLVWQEATGQYTVESVDMMTRMLWLSRCEELAALPLAILAMLAESTQVRHYTRNQVLCRDGQPVEQVFIVRNGVVLRDTTHAEDEEPMDPGCDELIGRLDTSARHDNVRVVSPSAQVLAVSIDGNIVRMVREHFTKRSERIDDDSPNAMALDSAMAA
jgi:hypothetical protein